MSRWDFSDSSDSEEEFSAAEDVQRSNWTKLLKDWTKWKKKEKLAVKHISYTPVYKMSGKGKKRKSVKKRKSKSTGGLTLWSAPCSVYHCYLTEKLVKTLMSNSTLDQVNVPDDWKLVERINDNLYITLTHLNEAPDYLKRVVFYVVFNTSKKRTQLIPIGQLNDLYAITESDDKVTIIEVQISIFIPLYFTFVATVSYDSKDKSSKKSKKSKTPTVKKPAKETDYTNLLNETLKKVLRKLRLITVNPDDSEKEIWRFLMSPPPKSKPKEHTGPITIHPYTLAHTDKTSLQAGKTGKIQMSNVPLVGSYAQPLRSLTSESLRPRVKSTPAEFVNRRAKPNLLPKLSLEKAKESAFQIQYFTED